MTSVARVPIAIPRPRRALPLARAQGEVRPARHRTFRPRGGLFLVAFAGYLAVALLVVLPHDALPGDALARVANAAGAVSGRDPHLAAIGFVWSPIPTLALIPLVALRGLWPELASVGGAACVISAAAMAGTVVAVRAALAELGVDRLPRQVGTLLFAAHPMIVLYGANGMSEALLLLFLVVALRSLARWWWVRSSGSLAAVGLALGLAYLCRYEAIMAGAAAVSAVFASTWWHSRDPWRDRLRVAVVDGSIVAFPITVAFVGWALASWLIVGHPFEQLSSPYGNSAQVRSSADVIGTATGWTAEYVLDQMLGLEPLLVLTLVVAGAAAVLSRSVRPLLPLLVFGPVIALQALIFTGHQSFGWLRFQIVVVPLAALSVGAAVGTIDVRNRARWPWRLVAVSVTAVLLVPSVVVAADVMASPTLAREEARIVVAVRDRQEPLAADARHFAFERAVAAELDELGLGRGEVLTDVAFSFPIVLASRQPTQFVITPDRDFQAALASPWVFGVRYLLVPPASGRAASADAVNLAYPRLHQGNAVATKIRDFADERGLRWRLFKVLPPPDAPDAVLAGERQVRSP